MIKEDTSWFPVNRAICMMDEDNEDD